MNITLLAIGTKMPRWVDEGYNEYSKRLAGGNMGADCKLTLKEIPSPRRSKSEDSATICRKEGELLLAAIPQGAFSIALDEHGKLQSTRSVADLIRQMKESSQSVAMLIGGADGLSDQVLQQCSVKWSLSQLTFPHAMVRVIVAEQIYRAVSLLNNHPYHRA